MLVKEVRSQGTLSGLNSLLIQTQSLFAAGGVFGQQDIGIGTIRPDSKGLSGQIGLALGAGVLESLAKKVPGLGCGTARIGLAPDGLAQALLQSSWVR
jgi:hypothetical protein